LLTLSAGMILGLLIGMIQFPAFGASVASAMPAACWCPA